MGQVKEVAARYREIAATGARVLLVSPRPHENTAALAKRFDVPFDFLTDSGNRAVRALEIAMKDGLPMGMTMLGYDAETVFPTVIVLDAGHTVGRPDRQLSRPPGARHVLAAAPPALGRGVSA